jgi:DNA modification methylase
MTRPPAESFVLPKQSQLLLPILEEINRNGGAMKAGDAIRAVTERLHVPVEHLKGTVTIERGCRKGSKYSPWRHDIEWARLQGVHMGVIDRSERGVWRVTEKGAGTLQNAAPGIVLIVYETPSGTALWAEAEAAVGSIADSTVNLLFTSPPYPLEGWRKKSYGNRTGADYLGWMMGLAQNWKRVLVDDGSLVLNLADVWQQGAPVRSLYQERLVLALCDELGLHLADHGFWHNPAKIPTSPWVTVKRVRLNAGVEHIYWFSKSQHPKANNRNVLQPYKRAFKADRVRARCPSGHLDVARPFARDNGGSIPHTLISASNSDSASEYFRLCRERGLTIHDARFPAQLPELWIKFLTDPGDLVYDPFSGSNTTGAIAERLGRRWIASERSLVHLQSSSCRFDPKTLRLPA